MRMAISLICILAVTAICLPAFALDNIIDTITGRNDEVPVNFRVEILKEIPTDVIPVLNMIPMIREGRTQIGIGGITPMGEFFGEYGSGEIITRIIF